MVVKGIIFNWSFWNPAISAFWMLLHGNLKSCGYSLIGWQLQEVSSPSVSRRPAKTGHLVAPDRLPRRPSRVQTFLARTHKQPLHTSVLLRGFLSILCSLDPTCWFFQPSLDPPRWVESGPPCKVGRRSFAVASQAPASPAPPPASSLTWALNTVSTLRLRHTAPALTSHSECAGSSLAMEP